MATKVCVVLESSSQGANGVKENEASFEFVRLIQCLERVLVNRAGCLGPAGCTFSPAAYRSPNLKGRGCEKKI